MITKYPVQEVSDVEMAFPAHVSHLMPPQEEIPKEFKGWPGNAWVELQSRWFYEGLKGVSFVPKEGIDPEKALHHLSCIQGSFEPRHEDKTSAVAFLLSEWFDDVLLDGKSIIKENS